MSRVFERRFKGNAAPCQMDSWIELLTCSKCKFPTTKEASPGQLHSSVKDGIVADGAVARNSCKLLENSKRDGELGIPNLFSIKTLDSADNSADCLRFASVEWKTFVDMEGTNGGQIGFNCFGLERASPKTCDPLNDDLRGCWQKFPRLVEQSWVKSGEIDEGTLTCGVGFASAGCKTMPKEGCSLS